MKLKLDKNVKINPDWQDLIGNSKKDVDAQIKKIWSHPLETIATGYNHYECVSYQNETTKAVLFFDNTDSLLDVFVYSFSVDNPKY